MSRSRKKSELKRREARREPNETILIVCEGEKTEPNYFNYLVKQWRLASVDVEVHGEKAPNTPKEIVKYAKRLLKERKNRSQTKLPFDQVWCVFDTEVPLRQNIEDALIQAEDNKMKLGISNPCFEFWFILHFTQTSRSFNSVTDVIRELRQYHSNYDKSDKTILPVLEGETSQAVKNAKELFQKLSIEEILKENSSTNIYGLVEVLKRYKSS